MLRAFLLRSHGGRFLNHMNTLLADLGMNRATYMSPYPQRNGNLARGYDGNNVTEMVGYGEYAAASLVSRPIDIARFIIRMNEALADASAQTLAGIQPDPFKTISTRTAECITATGPEWLVCMGYRVGLSFS